MNGDVELRCKDFDAQLAIYRLQRKDWDEILELAFNNYKISMAGAEGEQ